MSLLAEIRATRKQHPLCGVAIVLPQLNDEDHADLLEALSDPSVYATTISSTLRKVRDVDLSANASQRHRRGECQCDSPTS